MSKFKKGKSGNPSGRPKGTGYADKLRESIQADIPEIVASVVSKAKDGDMGAAKLLLDRVIPPLKTKGELIAIPHDPGGSLSEQGRTIITNMAQGLISPDEASSILSALSNQARIAEIDDLEQRIILLEDSQNDKEH